MAILLIVPSSPVTKLLLAGGEASGLPGILSIRSSMSANADQSDICAKSTGFTHGDQGLRMGAQTRRICCGVITTWVWCASYLPTRTAVS